MKIYMPNIDISKINCNTLTQYLQSTKYSMKIYTMNGIFEFKGGKLYKANIIDAEVERKYINNTHFLIDNSYYKFNFEQYQLPIDHVVEKINISQYILRKKAKLSLNIERIDNKIVDVYFLTSEDLENIPIQEDICTFLSHLN